MAHSHSVALPVFLRSKETQLVLAWLIALIVNTLAFSHCLSYVKDRGWAMCAMLVVVLILMLVSLYRVVWSKLAAWDYFGSQLAVSGAIYATFGCLFITWWFLLGLAVYGAATWIIIQLTLSSPQEQDEVPPSYGATHILTAAVVTVLCVTAFVR